MSRLLPICGISVSAMGFAWLVPVIAAWLSRGELDSHGYALASVAPVLIGSGAVCMARGLRNFRLRSIPAPVRAAIAANILFLAFCALELSDGLVRRGGRVFYWTSVLFLPALGVLYGQVLARKWAWWIGRVITGFFTAWFIGFLLLVPFVHLRGDGEAIPWWGRIYVGAVTIIFAGISVYAYSSLGSSEARTFYGIAAKA